jgi:hypothetical protein
MGAGDRRRPRIPVLAPAAVSALVHEIPVSVCSLEHLG